jgi:hypothetical protein
MAQHTQSARLDELLTFFGCPHDIPLVGARSFAERTGELISRAVNARWPIPRTAHLRSELAEASRSFPQRRRRGKR